MGPRISPKTTRRRTLFVLPLKTPQNCAIIRRITARCNRDGNTIFAKTCTWRKIIILNTCIYLVERPQIFQASSKCQTWRILHNKRLQLCCWLMQFEHDEALIDAQYQVLLVSMPLKWFLTIDDIVKHTSYTSIYRCPKSWKLWSHALALTFHP